MALKIEIENEILTVFIIHNNALEEFKKQTKIFYLHDRSKDTWHIDLFA